jgi:hypothetical protein
MKKVDGLPNQVLLALDGWPGRLDEAIERDIPDDTKETLKTLRDAIKAVMQAASEAGVELDPDFQSE